MKNTMRAVALLIPLVSTSMPASVFCYWTGAAAPRRAVLRYARCAVPCARRVRAAQAGRSCPGGGRAGAERRRGIMPRSPPGVALADTRAPCASPPARPPSRSQQHLLALPVGGAQGAGCEAGAGPARPLGAAQAQRFGRRRRQLGGRQAGADLQAEPGAAAARGARGGSGQRGGGGGGRRRQAGRVHPAAREAQEVRRRRGGQALGCMPLACSASFARPATT